MADNFGIGSGGARNISQFSIMSWNVEGLTELKENGRFVAYMTRFEIDVCCLQETRKTKSDVYMSHVLFSSSPAALKTPPSGMVWDLLFLGDFATSSEGFANKAKELQA